MPSPVTSGRRVAACLLIAVLLVAGCRFMSSEQGFTGVEFQNQTAATVEVVFMNSNGEESTLLHQLKPGTVITVDAFTTDCSGSGTYIARDLEGNEVARRFGPVCRPSIWVIEASSTAAPSRS